MNVFFSTTVVLHTVRNRSSTFNSIRAMKHTSTHTIRGQQGAYMSGVVDSSSHCTWGAIKGLVLCSQTLWLPFNHQYMVAPSPCMCSNSISTLNSLFNNYCYFIHNKITVIYCKILSYIHFTFIFYRICFYFTPPRPRSQCKFNF